MHVLLGRSPTVAAEHAARPAVPVRDTPARPQPASRHELTDVVAQRSAIVQRCGSVAPEDCGCHA